MFQSNVCNMLAQSGAFSIAPESSEGSIQQGAADKVSATSPANAMAPKGSLKQRVAASARATSSQDRGPAGPEQGQEPEGQKMDSDQRLEAITGLLQNLKADTGDRDAEFD